MAENLIRTKQINQADFSGAVQNVINSNEFQITYGGTGININNVGQIIVSGTDIYLIDSIFNVSGTGTFTALDLNNVDTLNLSGVTIDIQAADVTLGNNLNVSGNLTVAGTIKYNEVIDITTTGNISGYTGIFQNIGLGVASPTERLDIDGNIKMVDSYSMFWNGNNYINSDGATLTLHSDDTIGIDCVAVGITNNNYTYINNNSDGLPFQNFNVFRGNAQIQGTGTFWSGIDLKNSKVNNASNLVYNTGDQTINGTKTFSTGVVLAYAQVNTPTTLGQAKGIQWLSLGGTNYDQTIYAAYDGYQKIGINFRQGAVNLQDTIIFRPLKIEAFRPIEVSGTVTADNLVYNTGNQTISGTKTFINTGVFISGIDLQNSKLVNAVPEIINFTTNFNITGTHNSRVILGNSATTITGYIVSGNVTGFNTSIIQVGGGQIQITGSGSNVIVSSYSSQFKTSSQFAAISLLHTGNNRYIMYGNTAA